MTVELIRTFIAIELPDGVKSQIDTLETQLKKAKADLTWVCPRNIHLTLKFLGDTPEGRLADVREGIREAVASLPSFGVTLGTIGAFPSLDRPRVIWVDVQDGREDLIALQNRVEKALLQRRFVREERPYSPHLTIGRVRTPQGVGALVNQIRQSPFQAAPIRVSRVVIVKSELRQQGPLYTVLDHVPLA